MKVKKFQMGGGMAPAPEGAPQEGMEPGVAPQEGAPQGGSPEDQLAEMAMAVVQQLGPEAAAMLAQMIMQVIEQSAAGAPQGEPVYAKKGGKLVMIGRK